MSEKNLSDEDKELFRQVVKDVKPLSKNSERIETTQPLPNTIKRAASNPKPTTKSYHLSNYYTEPVYSDSLVSYSRTGIPLKRFKELRKGEIRWQARIDLHGLYAELAQDTLCKFIDEQIQLGHRCILIIHGKGGQQGEPPVLKNLVNHWLRQLSQVLAFHSALPRDGGTGALYVLLKRVRE